MSIFVHIKDIHFSYGRTPVLEGLSYTFKAGEMTAVLGHNGCGKSTLMKNIMGYLLPSSGVIDLASEGKSINSIGNSIRNRKELSRLVSFVPQRAGSFAASTVFDTVRMGRLPYLKNRWNGFTEEDRSKTVEVLRLLNLESFSERLLGCLSGGEQQKVLLARCLVQETPVIILDEATASMDIHHKVDIMETLKRRKEELGLTVIAVMHDLNLAARYSDTLCFLKGGQVLCDGTPSEAMTDKNMEQVYGLEMPVRKDEDGVPFVLPGRQKS